MEADRGERGHFPDTAHTQQSDIDPRLQETAPASHPSLNPPSLNGTTNQFRLPPPPPPPPPPLFQHLPHHHHQQPQYAPQASQWTHDGFTPYYGGASDQNPLPLVQVPQHATQVHPSFQDSSGTPMQPSMQTSLTDQNETKRPRACEACRNLKVRCEPDPAGGICKRCAKANRCCVITAPSRKRQKKTDSRVAELERKIDALTQNLKSTKEDNASGSDDYLDGGETKNKIGHKGGLSSHQMATNSRSPEAGQKRALSEYQQDISNSHYPPNPSFEPGQRPASDVQYVPPEAPMGLRPETQNLDSSLDFGDVVDRGVLGKATAGDLFDHYTKNMAPHMPIVIFSKNQTSEIVRQYSPTLFLAILSVASSQKLPDLQLRLKKEIMSIVADKIVNGNKSLEIIQAIQAIIVWYLPEPDKDSKYYQFIHMATGIAIDLGINKKADPKRDKFNVLQPNTSTFDTESLECRRAWLGCYLLYSSIAMGTRRPNLIPNDGYLQDCMTQLRLSEDPLDSDRNLVKLVYLQTLADDLSVQILPDGYLAISETKARSAHKGFERQMKAWQEENLGNMENLSLSLTYNVINLYMHELVMQHVAWLEPGKPPPPRSRGKNQSQTSPSAQASSLNVGLTSSLGILDTFLKFNVSEIRTLPTFFFAQIAHASVSLIKMYFVGRADLEFSKQTPVTADLVEERLHRLSDSLSLACDESLAAHTFLKMIVTLKTLFGEHKDTPLASIKARFSGMPSLKGAQLLDLGEPNPTPQQRTAARGSAETADEALHLLSAVAMGNGDANAYSNEAGSSAELDASVDGETAAMGQLIGEGDLGFMSDEGFIGIMQQMWARST